MSRRGYFADPSSRLIVALLFKGGRWRLDCDLTLDSRVMLVAHDLEVLELDIEDAVSLGLDDQLR